MDDNSSRGPDIWKDIGYPVIRDTLKLVLPWILAAVIAFAAGWWVLETYVWGPGRKVAEVVTNVTEATGDAISSTYEAGKEAAGNTIEATKEGADIAIDATKKFGSDMLEKAKDMIPGKADKPTDQTEAKPDAPQAGCWHDWVPMWGCPAPDAGK